MARPKMEVVVQYIHRDAPGEFWIDIMADGQLYAQLGPFASTDERQHALDDLLAMTRAHGAKDIPNPN